MSKKRLISTQWFPSCDFSAKSQKVTDQVFFDFDRQAEQFSGHDQKYLQLTSGPFEGRFLSAFFGPDVALHMEYCNQGLEQEVASGPDFYTFGVNLREDAPFYANGHAFGAHDFFLLPPETTLHVMSPLHGTVLAVAIRREVFLNALALSPNTMDWVLGLGREIGVLQAGSFAGRLREDAVCALEGLMQSAAPLSDEVMGHALVSSIVSKLALEWAGARGFDLKPSAVAYDRFVQCGGWLRSHAEDVVAREDVAQVVNTSVRSVEQAFFKTVSMGPLTYLRVLRLHEVKRKLSDPLWAHASIGDIAAESGFWDWSRFSYHYKRHFGELPSDVRRQE